MAKDLLNRNPGGNKKKWPLIVAGVLLSLLAVGMLCLWLWAHNGEKTDTYIDRERAAELAENSAVDALLE